MLSINMRIFKPVLLILAFGTNVLECLPVDESSIQSAESSTTLSNSVDHYDQRQNGTDNYRVHVDGVILVVAPVEALLLAGQVGQQTGNESNVSLIDASKPSLEKPKPEINSKPTAAPKSTHRTGAGLRLANFILPLLRRIRQD